MEKEDKKIIENKIRVILQNAVSSEYARCILEHEKAKSTFIDDVIDDVMLTSAWGEERCYNDDDIRLSIGRIFMERLGIEP